MASSEISVVHAWHQALNGGDLDRFIASSGDDVEVGGPRGASRGVQVLREWVGRAGIRLEPRRTYHRDHVVVVEEEAEWRAPGTGEVTGRLTPAMVFVLRDGRVMSVMRHLDRVAALGTAGLDEAAEVDE